MDKDLLKMIIGIFLLIIGIALFAFYSGYIRGFEAMNQQCIEKMKDCITLYSPFS